MKIAALGRTQMMYATVEALHNAGHKIVLIGTSPAVPEYTRKEKDFEQLAKQLKCPFFCDSNLDSPENLSLLKSCGADAAISINWLTVIQKNILNIFRFGVINGHAGDLPRYHGNACPNWAILEGESKVVLTLHQMVEDLDAGPILLQRTCPLTDDTYIGDIYHFFESTIPDMFVDVVNGLEEGTLVPRSQQSDPELCLRCYPRIPEDSEIFWNQSAESIARLVRASAEPFSGAYTYFNGRKLIIWRAYNTKLNSPSIGIPGQVIWICKDSGEVGVLTANSILVLQEIQLDNSERKKAANILTSTRLRLGMSVTQEIIRLKAQIAALEERQALLEKKK